MAQVFISYKKEDFETAGRVVAALADSGISVWWDESLTSRSAWDAEIEREIAAAPTVVVLWTPRSVSSDWVRTEAHYGQDHGKLIPVMIEACTIPIAFKLRQTLDLCDWRGERDHRQWRKLLAWIADLATTKADGGNVSPGSAVAQPHRFHDVIGRLASGEPIVDGTLVNASTPAGTLFCDGSGLPNMRIVPKGAFLLGSPVSEVDRSVAEGPQKRIEIHAPFAIGMFPVLVSEYEAVGCRPSAAAQSPRAGGWTGLFKRRRTATVDVSVPSNPSLPTTHVSFDDALEFVARLSSATGETYRLPSEAEWEYACRAGSRSRFSFGDVIDSTMALFSARTGPMAPGSFPANAFGLCDMHGNVREWTADLWHESYASTPPDGSPDTDGHSSMRVVRGGGWSDGPALLRSAARLRGTQSIRSEVIGFRVARALR
jgi:formylglycine-generating enzyme required for sulfatase activity